MAHTIQRAGLVLLLAAAGAGCAFSRSAKTPMDRLRYGSDGDFVDYVKGANLAGFLKVADAMMAYGAV